jgi:hypothetical protein
MTKETLRMQFLSGVITESEYKTKLNEQPDTDFIKSEMERHISMVNGNPEINDQEKKRRIDNIRFVVYDFLDPNTNGGKRPSSDFQFDDNWWNSIPSDIDKFVVNDAATDLVRAAKGDSFGENDVPLNEKDSLNEGMIGGIVGIGAINQIPPRAKTDYETAFEHFLGARYELNEEMESGEFDSYLTGLFDWIDLGDEYEEGPQSYTFEKMEWADEDALGGEEAEMFEPAHEYIKSKGEIKLTDPVSGTPLTFRTEGEDIVVDFNTEDF